MRKSKGGAKSPRKTDPRQLHFFGLLTENQTEAIEEAMAHLGIQRKTAIRIAVSVGLEGLHGSGIFPHPWRFHRAPGIEIGARKLIFADAATGGKN